MRKIETMLNDAILSRKDWKHRNTEVVYCPQEDASYVFLHGHHIATVGDNYVELFSRGYRTNTTKSRLNAILKEHGIDGEYIYQRNFNWYVNKYCGQLGAKSLYVEKEFTEGMILS
jgi:hypothetical protein